MREGHILSIPTVDGWYPFVVARQAPRGNIMSGWLFPIWHGEITANLVLDSRRVVWKGKVHDGGIDTGKWIDLGPYGAFDRQAFNVPHVRSKGPGYDWYVLTTDDRDPNKVVASRLAPLGEVLNLPMSDLMAPDLLIPYVRTWAENCARQDRNAAERLSTPEDAYFSELNKQLPLEVNEVDTADGEVGRLHQLRGADWQLLVSGTFSGNSMRVAIDSDAQDVELLLWELVGQNLVSARREDPLTNVTPAFTFSDGRLRVSGAWSFHSQSHAERSREFRERE